MEQARDHVVGMQGMTNVNEQVRRFTVAITCTRRVECKKKEDDENTKAVVNKNASLFVQPVLLVMQQKTTLFD